MAAHIRIATGPDERLKRGHIVAMLAGLWRAAGHTVSIGRTEALDADIGILHLDRTVIPPDLVPANPERRPFLNARLRDISKRRISRHLVARGALGSGPVIVKSNGNAFGKWERGQRPWYRRGRWRMRLAGDASWRHLRVLPHEDYPVLPSAAAVPDWVWDRDDLVVERFLSEREGDLFVLRVWIFLGAEGYGARLLGSRPVVKTGTMVRYDYIDDVPDAVRAMRRALDLDYGKIDYAIVDGEAVVYDVNKTPTAAAGAPSPNIERLARGLEPYLGSAR